MKRLHAVIIITALLSLGIFLWYQRGSSLKYAPKKVTGLIDQAFEKQNIVPIVVIGSGPAGLSAALYGARGAIYTVVFQGQQPGGQLTTTSYVENWPGAPKMLGSNLIAQAQKQAEHFGAIFINDTITKVDFSTWPFILHTEEGKVLHALSVIIATGSTPEKLKAPGEEEYWAKGVSSCAICDAPYFKDKKVVVVGGGDSAVEEAVLLSSFAKEVTILVRRDAMRAAPSMQNRLKQYSNIHLVYNSSVAKIVGDGEKVTRVEIKNNKDGTTSEKEVDGVFLAIGHLPSSTLFKPFIATDSQGYIQLAPRKQLTSLEGIFAAGDVADPEFKQAGAAAGDGIKAALGAIAFLHDMGFNETSARKLEKNYFEPESDKAPIELASIKTSKEFDEQYATKKEPVILDFYAPWCTSCIHMLPVVAAVATRFADKAVFVKVNTAEAEELAKRFKIPNVPWLVVVKDGKEIGRTNEVMSKRKLSDYVSQFIYE
jgi:thioredoxin reductase (NADPH)